MNELNSKTRQNNVCLLKNKILEKQICILKSMLKNDNSEFDINEFRCALENSKMSDAYKVYFRLYGEPKSLKDVEEINIEKVKLIIDFLKNNKTEITDENLEDYMDDEITEDDNSVISEISNNTNETNDTYDIYLSNNNSEIEYCTTLLEYEEYED